MMVPDELWCTPPVRAATAVHVFARAVARCTSRMAIPTTRFGQPASQCKKYRNRFGNTTTHCCTATAGYTCSTKCAAISTMRRVLHAAHTPRLLHDHATRNFCAHPYTPRRTYYYFCGAVSPTAISGRTQVPGSAQRFLLSGFGLATCQLLAAQHSPAGQPA